MCAGRLYVSMYVFVCEEGRRAELCDRETCPGYASMGVTQWNQGKHRIWNQEEKALLSLLLWTLVDPELRAVCLELLCPSSDAPVPQFVTHEGGQGLELHKCSA